MPCKSIPLINNERRRDFSRAQLADWGADVVKIELPRGLDERTWAGRVMDPISRICIAQTKPYPQVERTGRARIAASLEARNRVPIQAPAAPRAKAAARPRPSAMPPAATT